ncbi:DUF4255 domain-containing protein [Spirosoma panaciterrae]|uniref:DUF4255 domain-containing protein n=1 Tax=Spirosoma panaciterrae TaxID=496058 RepID=UPI000378A067|nr:DUF4255 domain-containing protein [Spirosoma panaciterrae]
MIDFALQLLQSELETYLKTIIIDRDTLPDDDGVVLDNIAFLQTTDGAAMKSKVVITLVNIEEEKALKNINPIHRTLSGFEHRPNPVSLNLYLLFTAYYPGTDTYIGALKRLSYVISFFQMRNHFTIQNSSAFLAKNDKIFNPAFYEEASKLRLVLDLYTLTFEQINHLWASLGGRQVPFVMYKARLVQIREPDVRQEVPVIEEIRSTVQPL